MPDTLRPTPSFTTSATSTTASGSASGSAKTSLPPSKKPSKPPKVKKKRSWWKFYFLLFILGSGYVIYKFPQQFERYSGVEIPQPIHTAINFIKKRVEKQDSKSAPAAAPKVAAKATPKAAPAKTATPAPTAPTTPKVSNNEMAESNLDSGKSNAPENESMETTGVPDIDLNSGDAGDSSTAFQSNEQPIVQSIATPIDLQTEIWEEIAALDLRFKKLQDNYQHTHFIQQLQLIDLELQLNGDTRAAEKKLQQISTNAPQRWKPLLENEQQRLAGILPRQAVVIKIRELIENEKERQQQARLKFTQQELDSLEVVKQLFNFRQYNTEIGEKKAYAHYLPMLQRLEVLMLDREYGEYWKQLRQLEKDVKSTGSADQLQEIQQLIQYNAVTYQLKLDIDATNLN